MHSNLYNRKKQWLLGILGTFAIVTGYTTGGILVTFALLAMPIAATLAVRITGVFLFLFILFSYFRFQEAFPILEPLKLPKLLAIASLVGIFWHLFVTQHLKPYWHSALFIFSAFFGWLIISALFALDKSLSITYWTQILIKIFIIVFAISWWVRDIDALLRIRLGIMLSGTIIGCVAMYNKIQGIGLVEGTRVTIPSELRGPLSDPNDLSLVLLFPVSFLSAEVLKEQSTLFRRILACICLLVITSGIIATQSRGGLLGVAAIMGFFFYQRVRNLYITGSVAMLGIVLLAAVAGISDRQSGGAAEEGIDASAMGRLYAWQAAFRMGVSNPLTGVGIENFYPHYFFYSSHWDGKNHAVHSTWFQVLAETGFVGLALFVALIVAIFRILRRTRHTSVVMTSPTLKTINQSLQAGLLAFCVSGTFLTQAFTWPLYIILALAIVYERLVQQNIKST